MEKRVLVISTVETFTVKGLRMKLQGIGVFAQYATCNVKEISRYIETTDLYIYYMDDEIASNTDVLVLIKDMCFEMNKKLILIGTKLEYEVATKIIPSLDIYRWFERPLDMLGFLDIVDDFFTDETQEAQKKSILIVDDDVTYMRMIKEWLDDIYRVAMANSGTQAIKWLAKNSADLILLDYEMPVTPGPKVLEMLRSDLVTSSIPVMFLTGKRDSDSVMEVLALHPTDYMLKSIDRDTLRRKLSLFFQKQAAASRNI
ncbi:MAG: response regulator [Lachnospiraceae bacterium]|nr:response regulator [Lachnospiraceae bacterium]